MEGVVQRDDGGTVFAVLVKAVLPGQLDHALVGFAAAIGKKDAALTGALAQDLGKAGGGLGVEEVGHVPQLLGLGGDGICPGSVAVAQVGDTDAAGKVDVGISLRVVEGSALTVVDGHREAAVGMHDVLVRQGHDVFAGHASSSFFSMVPMPRSESSSIKMEWGMRPSRMWTRSTPPWMASTLHSILGIMPPEMTPWAMRAGTS